MSQPTAEEFAKYVESHEMTVLHEDGVYRHITFGVPDSGIDRFNLTTFPGRLVFTGDRGDYLFERTNDMFQFFRNSSGEINEDYWAEKCVASDRDGIKVFSGERFKEVILQQLEDMEADANTRAAVEEYLLDSTDEMTNESAHREVSNFALVDEDGDDHEVFSDSYEYDFTEYTRQFIWCLRAIVWGIAKYDSERSKCKPN